MSSFRHPFNKFLISVAMLTVIVLLAFAILQWLQVPSGSFLDWLIGIVSFWWLLVIVTLPWNIHFQAREVLSSAATSIEKGIIVKKRTVESAGSWAKRSLIIAVLLHVVSAAVLYYLARTGISPVGYVSAGAALLLTFLRPVVRGYDYLMAQLRNAEVEVRYPREDMLQLKNEVREMASEISDLLLHTDPERDGSWAAQQQAAIGRIGAQLQNLHMLFDEFQKDNGREHAELVQNSEQMVAQIARDGGFIDHVREIIRFFKTA